MVMLGAQVLAATVPTPPGGWQADQVRELLCTVPDPEIPVVGIGELGILREVRAIGLDGFEVVITPTYSGCPAMEQIADDLRAVLAQHHINGRITTRLAPAWSTDWLTPDARDKLRAYGIAAPGACAPPAQQVARGQVIQFAAKAGQAHDDVPCPRCGSANTTQTSHFGSTACKALYRCLDCLEPFDYFKPY